MARKSTVIEVFVSSPSDVDEERRFIKSCAQEWNLLRSRTTGCFISPITWEDLIAPALGDRPQSVINEQIGDEYDVYLGVMWGRFGSPTGAADSGTAEEFNRALDRYRGGDAIRLAMLFKTAPIPPSDLSGEQFDKVQEFKKQFAAEGGLYREFGSEEELRHILNLLFEQMAEAKDKIVQASSAANKTEVPQTDVGTGGREEDEFGDMGLLEFNEQLTEVVELQTQFFQSYGAESERYVSEIENANQQMQDLTKFGRADPSSIKPIMVDISASMDGISSFIEENIAEFVARNDRLIRLTDAGLDIAGDFPEAAEGKEELRAAVMGVISMLVQNKASTGELIETVRGLPRMTTVFNKAKKRAVEAQQALMSEFDRLFNSLGEIVEKHGREP